MHSVWRSRWRAAGRIVHQDRLDERAVRQPMECLLGQPAVGQPDLGVVDRIEAERGVELGPRSAAGIVRISAGGLSLAAPDGIGDLAGAIRRARRGREPRLELPAASPDSPGRGSRAARASGVGVGAIARGRVRSTGVTAKV